MSRVLVPSSAQNGESPLIDCFYCSDCVWQHPILRPVPYELPYSEVSIICWDFERHRCEQFEKRTTGPDRMPVRRHCSNHDGSTINSISRDGFSRRLVHQAILIESRCDFCGFVIVGRASGTLPKAENVHASNCFKRHSKRSVGRAAS